MLVTLAQIAGGPGPATDVDARRAGDPSCLVRMARGDADALAELYDRHGSRIYSLALRMLRNPQDSEEVVQEVFAQAWRSASRYDAARAPVTAWLLMMARSRALDRLRRRPSAPHAPEEALGAVADPEAGPDTKAATSADVGRLRAALDALPFLQRTAIELAFFEGLSHTEVAERLEQPLGTVKTRIRLGLLKLREALGGGG
jgi:RNA polymerase sigma-70 factor (ECF subfamily)